jgi:Acetylglutamate semialdehyde dehydrogenase
MIKIGILGSTGYAGSELVRLLSSHPYAEIVFLDSRSYENKSYTDIYPHLESKLDKNCSSIDLMDDSHFKNLDLLFCALPHGLSQIAVKQGLKIKLR